MHYRDGAIGHSVELVESAGFKAGGHKEEVGGCCQAVSHGDAEPYPAAALLLSPSFHRPAEEGKINSGNRWGIEEHGKYGRDCRHAIVVRVPAW